MNERAIYKNEQWKFGKKTQIKRRPLLISSFFCIFMHFGGADRAIRECGRESEYLVLVGLVLLLTIRLKTSECKHVLTS